MLSNSWVRLHFQMPTYFPALSVLGVALWLDATLQCQHLTKNDNGAFLWASWTVIRNTLYHQPLSSLSWVSLGSAWAMSMPNLPWSFSKVNCAVHTAQHGEKKHHRRVICERKIKLGLPPYATKHSSPPAMGWSIFAVGERHALQEAWEEQWAHHGKSINRAAAFALPEESKPGEEPEDSHSRCFCRS